ncbi:MAG: glycosyltransferase family 2 protein, partial [Patescibacteria group bacterium]|nr:glycosyltransferase [Patescibacteria group bacterium]
MIIPVYEQNKELDFCLRALDRQLDPPSFEVVIIDDASKESISYSVFDKFHFSVRVFRLNKNLGASTARNIGIRFAKNPILVFLDADMLVPRNFLRVHMKIHPPYSNIISISFRESILLPKIRLIKRKPCYMKDFRYQRIVEKRWQKQYSWLP